MPESAAIVLVHHSTLFLHRTVLECGILPTLSTIFRWASQISQGGRYAFIIKVDDDNVMNPYQLRLVLHKLPARENIFWGKQAPTFGRHAFSVGPMKHIGPIYLMSADIAAKVWYTCVYCVPRYPPLDGGSFLPIHRGLLAEVQLTGPHPAVFSHPAESALRSHRCPCGAPTKSGSGTCRPWLRSGTPMKSGCSRRSAKTRSCPSLSTRW